MHKLFAAPIILLILYIVFFDLKYGTLPKSMEKPELASSASTLKLAFFEEKVNAGDTVLTIVENNLEAQLPVSIHEIVSDFKELNKGISPEKIQIGKTYRFPDYSKQ